MKKALILWGGWDGHEPEKCSNIIAKWLGGKGFNIIHSHTLDSVIDEDVMNDLRLIVPCWTMGEITNEQCDAMISAVRQGCGIAGWHGGMCDSFRNNTEYQFMTGGQWVAHPGNIIRYRVHVKQDTDGFMAGLNDFDLESEQYYMHTDPGNEVLATTTFRGDHASWIAGTVMPVAWKRMYGRGRVFYSSLGHVAGDFEVPEVLEIIKRGILWAGGEEIVPEYTSL